LPTGRDSARGGNELAWNTTYLTVFGPKADNTLHLRNPPLFCLLRQSERPGVGDMAKVLVQVFLQNSDVPRFESSTPFKHEFDLRGFRIV
jgi:hypothetical protein